MLPLYTGYQIVGISVLSVVFLVDDTFLPHLAKLQNSQSAGESERRHQAGREQWFQILPPRVEWEEGGG